MLLPGTQGKGIRRLIQSNVLRGVAGLERLAGGGVPALHEMRNFVYLEHSLALGTAIHGTPVLSMLKAVLPKARIVAAASGFGLGVLRGNPHLEQLIETPSPLRDLRGAVRGLRAAKLFGGDPYAVLMSTGNLRTKFALAAALAGGHVRVGFSVHPELVAAPLHFDHALSQIANNLRIVEALGHGDAMRCALAARPKLAEPVVFPSGADMVHVRAELVRAGLSLEEPLAVFITQTSVTQRKSWRPERFQQVAAMLAREYGLQIVLGGTAAEAPAIEALREEMEARTANLAGKTTLTEMAALFGMARVALTLDTGPMHLARAMGTPMVIVAPAWSPPVEWLPVGNPKARILKNLTMDTAPAEYVIDEVAVGEVEAALRDLLVPEGNGRGPAALAR